MTDEQTIIEPPAIIPVPADETPANETVITEAVSIIDAALA